MFDFRFVYTNENDIYHVYNVAKVSIQTEDGLKEISKCDISNSNIPIQTLYLYSENGNYIVFMKDVRAIEIIERKDN